MYLLICFVLLVACVFKLLLSGHVVFVVLLWLVTCYAFCFDASDCCCVGLLNMDCVNSVVL